VVVLEVVISEEMAATSGAISGEILEEEAISGAGEESSEAISGVVGAEDSVVEEDIAVECLVVVLLASVDNPWEVFQDQSLLFPLEY